MQQGDRCVALALFQAPAPLGFRQGLLINGLMSERSDRRDLSAVILLSGVADWAFGSDDARFATAVASSRGFRATILVFLLPLLVRVLARVYPASTPTTTTTAATSATAST